MTHVPIYLGVGNVENPLKSAARKSQPERVTNRTLRPVTTNDIFSGDRLVSVRSSDLGHNSISFRCETFKLGVPPNVSLTAPQVFVKKLFGFALFQHQHKRERAQSLSDVRKIEFTSNLSVYNQ